MANLRPVLEFIASACGSGDLHQRIKSESPKLTANLSVTRSSDEVRSVDVISGGSVFPVLKRLEFRVP